MMEVEGSKRVKLVGKDDERQITAGLFGGSLMGDFALTVMWYTKGRQFSACLNTAKNVCISNNFKSTS